jgi:hypothetical protein
VRNESAWVKGGRETERGTRSASPLKADIRSAGSIVGFGPIVLKKSSLALAPIFQEPLMRLRSSDAGDRLDLSRVVQSPSHTL